MFRRETREAETRVAATPATVAILVNLGCRVLVQTGAGYYSGFSDQDYYTQGADIVGNDLDVYRNVDLVLQVKRPAEDLQPAILANLSPDSAILGILDPLAPHHDHILQYQRHRLTTFAWELLPQGSFTESFDAIAAMSRITGQIVIDQFMKNASIYDLLHQRILVIGLGNAGLAAAKQALYYRGNVTGVATSQQFKSILESWKGEFVQIPKQDLTLQQSQIRDLLLSSDPPFDLVVCAAGQRGNTAPLLITTDTLNQLKKETVIYDLTASSGGNCEGNQFGQTVQIGQGIICNTTGYPKLKPQHSTPIYADCVLTFVTHLLDSRHQSKNIIDNCLQSCLTTSGLITPILTNDSNSVIFSKHCQQWYQKFLGV